VLGTTSTQSAPLPCWVAGRLGDGALRARSERTGDTGPAEWPVALSLLQFRAQLQGPAEDSVHPPFRPLGTPRCAGRCNELPRPALLLGVRQHLALPLLGELARQVGGLVHVTHLL
jgi:hypothetical protein